MVGSGPSEGPRPRGSTIQAFLASLRSGRPPRSVRRAPLPVHFDWVGFVQEAAVGAVPFIWVYQPPGGRETYENPDANGVYPAHWASRAVLVRVSASPIRYERRLPDGAVEVYAQSDGAPVGQRRVFLTELIDPAGQALQFTWDAQRRLVAITDAIGQVTTIGYEDVDPLKITRLTDPFGRSAVLTYNAAGQLASITDTMGLTSAFGYGDDDFVNSLRTPYGITTFRHEPNDASSKPPTRWAAPSTSSIKTRRRRWRRPRRRATSPQALPTGTPISTATTRSCGTSAPGLRAPTI